MQVQVRNLPRASVSVPRAETATSVTLATVGAAVAIAAGWYLRGDLPLNARDGLGYALGVIGLGAMCALLTYSARKHIRLAARLGPLRGWFRLHMLLGIAAPVAILYHAGFRWGATNSAVAMACVLIVSGSGLVGRLLYTRIHRGLSGERVTLEDLRRELDSERGAIEQAAPDLARRLAALHAHVPHEPRGIVAALLGAARAARAVARTRSQCDRWLREASSRAALAGRVRDQIDAYFGAVTRSTRFAVYERFFALWHALHLPLCFLLFATAAIHVVAVHLY